MRTREGERHAQERAPPGRKARGCAYTCALALVGLAGHAVPASAQSIATSPAGSVALSLADAVKRALEWHPSVDVAVGQLAQSQADVRVAQAGYYPQLTAGITPGMEVYQGLSWQPQLQFSASQMLYDFGKVSNAVDAAQAEVRVNRAQLLSAVDGLVRDTAYAVIETQRYKALLQVAQDQLAAVRGITDLVEQRAAKGASPRSDSVQAEARVDDADNTVLQISSELSRWRNTLAHMIGSTDLPDVTADVPQWYRGVCADLSADWNQVPQVLQYMAKRDEAEANLREAQARRMPTVAFQVQGTSYIRDPFRDRSDITFGVNVSTTVFDGGALRARRDSAALALRTADAALDNARNDASRGLDEARSQVAALARALAVLATRNDKMVETSQLYRRQYFDLGTRTLLDLLNSEQELHQSRFDYVNHEHDLRRLNQDCLYNMGRTREAFALAGTRLRGVVLGQE